MYMNEMQEEMYHELCKLSGEQVTDLFLDWLGLQVLDKDFREFLGKEGYMDELPDDEDEDEDEDEEETEEEPDEDECQPPEGFEKFCYDGFGTSCVGCPFENINGADCEDLYRKMMEEKANEV